MRDFRVSRFSEEVDAKVAFVEEVGCPFWKEREDFL